MARTANVKYVTDLVNHLKPGALPETTSTATVSIGYVAKTIDKLNSDTSLSDLYNVQTLADKAWVDSVTAASLVVTAMISKTYMLDLMDWTGGTTYFYTDPALSIYRNKVTTSSTQPSVYTNTSSLVVSLSMSSIREGMVIGVFDSLSNLVALLYTGAYNGLPGYVNNDITLAANAPVTFMGTRGSSTGSWNFASGCVGDCGVVLTSAIAAGICKIVSFTPRYSTSNLVQGVPADISSAYPWVNGAAALAPNCISTSGSAAGESNISYGYILADSNNKAIAINMSSYCQRGGSGGSDSTTIDTFTMPSASFYTIMGTYGHRRYYMNGFGCSCASKKTELTCFKYTSAQGNGCFVGCAAAL